MSNEKSILIIDDDNFILRALESRFIEKFGVTVLCASSHKEAELIIEKETNIVLAIDDLNLPDCEDGAVVELTTSKQIPTVILTGTVNETLKESLNKKNIIEYILKGDVNSFDYLEGVVNRVLKNYDVQVLVVDDNKSDVELIQRSLKVLNISSTVANNGVAALEVLQKNKDISMVITGYDMPKMNGVELTEELRSKYNKDSLCIIALSAKEDKSILLNFLKLGANDFLHKPFEFHEFALRVNSNLDTLDLFKEIQLQKAKFTTLATTDMLTKCANKMKYITVLKQYCSFMDRTKDDSVDKRLYMCYMHLGGMSKFNEENGYRLGDKVLLKFVEIVNTTCRTKDTLYRILGTEFALLMPKISQDEAKKITNDIYLDFKHIPTLKNIKLSIGLVQYTKKEGIDKFSSRGLRKMLEATHD